MCLFKTKMHMKHQYSSICLEIILLILKNKVHLHEIQKSSTTTMFCIIADDLKRIDRTLMSQGTLKY